MLNNTKNNELFYKYYERWIQVYKTGAVRKVTLDKYILASEWLKKLVPNLRICDITRIEYQQLINSYAEFHERQTTMDFHHLLKGAILDAVDERLIDRDPTRKVIIKGNNILCGTAVTAEDLRGGAALVIAGLMAQGDTVVRNTKYIKRGYSRFADNIRRLGGDIRENEKR